MSRKSDDKKFQVATDYTYKCECGHSVVIYPFEHIEKKLCTHCGHYVYNEKGEFKKNVKKALK